MTGAALAEAGTGCWSLTGDVDLASAGELLDYSSARMDFAGELTVDLSGTGRVDSAGLALVVHWARLSRAAGGRLRLLAVPEQMDSLAAVSGLDTALLDHLRD